MQSSNNFFPCLCHIARAARNLYMSPCVRKTFGRSAAQNLHLWLPLAESSASFYEQFEFSYKGFTSMHPGRAALDYAVNRDRERVESAGCSALSWKCALAASFSAAPENLGSCRSCRSAIWRRMVPSLCSFQRVCSSRLNWHQLFHSSATQSATH